MENDRYEIRIGRFPSIWLTISQHSLPAARDASFSPKYLASRGPSNPHWDRPFRITQTPLKFELPSMFWAVFMDGKRKFELPSTFWAVFMDGVTCVMVAEPDLP